MTSDAIDTMGVRVAKALGRAIADQDEAALDALYADDIVIWHNSDDLEQTKTENLESLRTLFELCSWVYYADPKCHPIEGGFVQQHRLAGESRSGQAFDIPACVVVQVRDEKIIRLDEYIDPSPLLAMLTP